MPPSLHQELVAQSAWLDFDVGAPQSTARETWLAHLLRAPPGDAGAFVGDYLPSLLAAAPDARVARALIDATYSSVDLIGVPAARDALESARKTESDPAVKRAITDALVHFGRRPPHAEIR
ncbi:MAG: hypothetical protein ACJ731_01120 [Vicinamibacterales bacterium]